MAEPDERTVFAALEAVPDPGFSQGLLDRLLDEIADAPSRPSNQHLASASDTTNGPGEELLMVDITEGTTRQQRARKRWWMGGTAVAAAVLIVVGIVAVSGDSDDDTTALDQSQGEPTGEPSALDSEIDPAQVIRDHFAAYNSGDIDAVMAFYTEESVVTGHPVGSPQRGLGFIRSYAIQDRGAAAEVDPYTISNVEALGNTVTWDHVWIDGAGNRRCVEGLSAVIEDGKIVSWLWPDTDFVCR